MGITLAIPLLAAVFGVQLLLCRRAKRIRIKLVPLMLIGLGEALCGLAYCLSVYMERMGRDLYGAAFAAVIYGIFLLFFLVADGAAWAIHGLMITIQNHKNKFVL